MKLKDKIKLKALELWDAINEKMDENDKFRWFVYSVGIILVLGLFHSVVIK